MAGVVAYGAVKRWSRTFVFVQGGASDHSVRSTLGSDIQHAVTQARRNNADVSMT